MTSVTQRIAQIKQPRGGYLNIHASLVGLAVDYMTRYTMGAPAEQAFEISLLGSSYVKQEDKARTLLQKVKGLDDQSILSACQLVGYDVCRRAGILKYRPVEDIQADEKTTHNVRTMVNRSLAFWASLLNLHTH